MNIDPASIHLPVLLKEVLEAISPHPGGRYLDGTIGMGGHASEILGAALAKGGPAEICGLDRDTQALELAQKRLDSFGSAAHLFHLRYSQFEQALDSLGWTSVDGALLDLGVSSLQLDFPSRGFSFYSDGPLDMRMDQRNPSDEPVSRLVNKASLEELKSIIARYGEEPQAGRIAAAIVRTRQKKPFETTSELASTIETAYPAAWRAKARNHPATRTFQALRMAVNDELGELEQFLDAILPRLSVGGRLVIIAFHSLEDRIIKHRMKDWAAGCICPKSLPVCICHHTPEVRILTPRPLVASEDEKAKNSRSSCAKLRAAEKLESTPKTLIVQSGTFERDMRPTSRKARLEAREKKLLRRCGGRI